MNTLDALDARILLARDRAPDLPLIDLAHQLGISRNTVHARLRRLREGGQLGAPSASVPPEAVGHPVLAFVTLEVSQRGIDSVYAGIAALPEVLEVHTTTGSSDLLLRVVARDTVALHRTTQALQAIDGVDRRNTMIATTEVVPYRMAPLLHQLAIADR